MSCERFAESIALLAGGDLPERKALAVRAHLGTCPECRDLLAELEGTIADTRTLAVEPADVRLLAEVRAGVLARLAAQPGSRRWLRPLVWRGALAGTTLALVLLAIGVARRPAEPTVAGEPAPAPGAARPTASPAPSLLTPAQPPVVVASTTAPTHHPASRRQRPATATSRATAGSGDVTMVLLTNDPNVVIYWLPDSKGGSECTEHSDRS